MVISEIGLDLLYKGEGMIFLLIIVRFSILHYTGL